MKTALALGLCVVLLLASGCVSYYAPVMPPSGMLFSAISAPMDVDLDQTSMGMSDGSASSYSILSLVAFGDCSIEAAADDGGLRTINHADYKYLNVLGAFSMFTTVVHGN